MQQRFEAIRHMLDYSPRPKVNHVDFTKSPISIDKQKLSKEIRSAAPDLYHRLQKFQELLTHKAIGGLIDLGTDVSAIPWESMPNALAACFKPEYDYQPDEITKFGITVKHERTMGAMTIGLEMQRNERWWSYVVAGAIVRKDLVTGTEFIMCQSEQGQPKEARLAMRSLLDTLWGRHLPDRSSDNQIPHLIYGVMTLRFTESVLDFAVGELERRVQIRNPKK